jgi:PAS domain S-box-containing protein
MRRRPGKEPQVFRLRAAGAKTGGNRTVPLLRVGEYIGAAVLAWGAAAWSFQSPSFREIRLALSFCVIAWAALTGGIGPAVLAVGVSALTVSRYQRSWVSSSPLSVAGLIPTAILGLSVGLLLLLAQRRYVAETRLRRLVKSLREHAEALTRAQQASRSAVWSYDAASGETHWCQGGAEIFGRPHPEIMGIRFPMELVVEEDRGKVAAEFERALGTGSPLEVEFRTQWPSGEIRWLEARGTPLGSAGGTWRGATIDVTERKRAEQSLIQHEKLAIAGRLAASIAHEINNPLEAITNLCYLARATSTSAESSRYIQMAEEELSRVAQITSQTLRFHRQQTAAVDTDLSELTRSILALFEQKLAEHGIAARLRSSPAPPLRCFSGEIRQVLANLVGNAVDAMPEGGVLRLGVRETTDWKSGKRGLRITVADNGHGMAPETLKRLYEPFYTTKAERGTGLGLWVSTTLIEKHQGCLRVRSTTRPGRTGTVFSIVLPYPEKNGHR